MAERLVPGMVRSGRRLAWLAAAVVALSGCACRSKAEPSGFEHVVDLYNRNAVVATPTLVGNGIGTAVGAPLAIVAGCLAAPVALFSGETFEQVGGRVFDHTVWASAYAGGFVFGTLFVPISQAFPEDPDYCFED